MKHVASLTIPEVIDRAREKETNEEKIRYIKMHRSSNFYWFIEKLYNNKIADMGIKIPDYTPTHYPIGMAPMSFKTAIARFENSCRLWNSNPTRAENLLVLVLENVSHGEAELFKMLIRGQKKFDGISKSVWKGVYPDLFQSGQD